jgi:hypothetical protein
MSITLVLAVLSPTVARTGQARTAEQGGDAVGDHGAVAIPFGLAVAESQAMRHARARKPVIGLGIDRPDRIRTDAQIAASERLGDPAFDRQVEGGGFNRNRREIALKIRVGRLFDGGSFERFDGGHAAISRLCDT